jgi:von Willebrand factor type A domain
MRHQACLAVLAFSAVTATLVGCSSSDASSFGGSSSAGSPSDPGSGSGGDEGAAAVPGSESGGSTANGGGTQAGTLTAGDWDDNLNSEIFTKFVTKFATTNTQYPSPDTIDRVPITVKDANGAALPNITVEVSEAGRQTPYMKGTTGSDGRLLFFPTHDGAAKHGPLTVTLTDRSGSAPPKTQAAPATASWELTYAGAPRTLPPTLDLAFVIDTTGSMGDEIRYLQTEVQSIAQTVLQRFPGVTVRYGLVLYKDVNDSYVTKKSDFTTDLQKFELDLKAQSAGGGGDIPEAVEEGIASMNELSWSTTNAAHVAFWIADAPPHAADAPTYFSGIEAARKKGIRIYPVGASGVDDNAEYLMRMAAQQTAARYLFLTDDSGVGNAHAEPHIPCYQVQHLNNLMVRMIDSELTGTRVAAPASDVVRSVGSPQGNVCTMKDASTASF